MRSFLDTSVGGSAEKGRGDSGRGPGVKRGGFEDSPGGAMVVETGVERHPFVKRDLKSKV